MFIFSFHFDLYSASGKISKLFMLTTPRTPYVYLVRAEVFNLEIMTLNLADFASFLSRFADALALGTEFRIVDKKNLFGIIGNGAYSQLWLDTALSNQAIQKGFKYLISLQKLKGNFRFNLSQTITSRDFNINDMGYITATNLMNATAKFSYNIY